MKTPTVRPVAQSSWSPRHLLGTTAAARGLAGLLVGLGLASATTDSSASTMVAMTLKDLVDRSDEVAVFVPKSRFSRWEDGRIVTYTSVAVDTAVAGKRRAGDTVVVRTMGGIVGEIGQNVAGEAVLPLDKPVVAFLSPFPGKLSVPGSFSVVGMSQGTLPVVVEKDKSVRIGLSAYGLSLVPSPTAKDVPAAVSTKGKLLTEVTSDIRTLFAAKPR